MEKELIPYEKALSLKELGFDEPCYGMYYTKSGVLRERSYCKNSDFTEPHQIVFVSAPTFSQAFRWFREKHNLMFQIYYLRNGNHSVIIHKTTPEYMDIVDQLQLSSGCVDEVVDCYSYEQAELECLEKLIEIVKKQK